MTDPRCTPLAWEGCIRIPPPPEVLFVLESFSVGPTSSKFFNARGVHFCDLLPLCPPFRPSVPLCLETRVMDCDPHAGFGQGSLPWDPCKDTALQENAPP